MAQALSFRHIFIFALHLGFGVLRELSLLELWNVIGLTLIFIGIKLPMHMLFGKEDGYPLHHSLLLKFAHFIFAYYPFAFLRVFFSAPVSLALTKARGTRNQYVTIEAPEVRGIWFGPRQDNDVVLFYIHGGGFAFCSPILYAEFLSETLSEMQTSGWKRPAVFAVDYEHVPARRFPYQVQQVCQSYSFLVEDCKIPPHRIVLAGDSAGANLILSFLHHCTFPNPFISTIHTAPPAFAILISPWSNLACPAPETNNSSIADFIHAPSLRHHAALYAGIASSPRPPLSLLTVALESLYIFAEGSPRYSAEEQELIKQSQSNPSISPLSCRDWSQTLPSCGICVTYGSTELLAQDAVNLAFSLKKTGVVPVEVYERRNMPHVWPMFALYLGASEEERSEGPRFLAERIKSSLQTRS